jgi:phage tail P2-like protein
MRSLQTIRLAELLPSSITADPFAAALAEAFDYEFHLLVEDTANILLFANIANQPAEVLDHLAYQFGVDFYDQTMTLAEKRELISKALYWHSVKGTPHAVENVVALVFGEGVLEEWFDYGGQPHHFRVRTAGGQFPDNERYDRALRMIGVVKRASQLLEAIQIEQSADHPLYIGGAIQIGQYITVGSP